MITCDYGCGQEGKFYFKRPHKWCCSPTYWQCSNTKAWNKGIKIDYYSTTIQAKIREASHRGGKNSSHRGITPEKEIARREKISQAAKLLGFGGYRKGSGRGKKGWYKGYWCDSSWELAWVIFSLDNEVEFVRNWKTFPYTFDGQSRNWIPDFKLTSGEYVEIKGYFTDQVKAKLNQFPQNEKLIVIDKYSITNILNYITTKYGKDYIKLYDGAVAESA